MGIMGNSESNINISKEEYDDYSLYKQQQNFLKKMNQEQTLKTQYNNTEKFIDNEYRNNSNIFLDKSYKYKKPVSNKNNPNKSLSNNIEIDREKIDPFNLLGAHKN